MGILQLMEGWESWNGGPARRRKLAEMRQAGKALLAPQMRKFK